MGEGRQKIIVVGGGSQFAIGLCESFIDYGRDLLAGCEIALLDIDEPHLRTVHDYASRLAKKVGVEQHFTCTTDRKQAFQGADFILTTFRPGTHAQQEQDESVPVKYGLQGNETVGIGGIFMAWSFLGRPPRSAPSLFLPCAPPTSAAPGAFLACK